VDVVLGQEVAQDWVSLPGLRNAPHQILRGGLDLLSLAELILVGRNGLVEAAVQQAQGQIANNEQAAKAAHDV